MRSTSLRALRHYGDHLSKNITGARDKTMASDVGLFRRRASVHRLADAIRGLLQVPFLRQGPGGEALAGQTFSRSRPR